MFLSNGEEAFRPEDIPRNAVVFISKGEPFSGYDGGKLGAFDIAVQFIHHIENPKRFIVKRYFFTTSALICLIAKHLQDHLFPSH